MGNNDGLLIAHGWKMYRGYNNPVDKHNLRNKFFYTYNCNNSFKMYFFSEYRCDDLDLQISALGNYQRRGDRPYSRRVQIIKNRDRRVQLGRADDSPLLCRCDNYKLKFIKHNR